METLETLALTGRVRRFQKKWNRKPNRNRPLGTETEPEPIFFSFLELEPNRNRPSGTETEPEPFFFSFLEPKPEPEP